MRLECEGGVQITDHRFGLHLCVLVTHLWFSRGYECGCGDVGGVLGFERVLRLHEGNGEGQEFQRVCSPAGHMKELDSHEYAPCVHIRRLRRWQRHE